MRASVDLGLWGNSNPVCPYCGDKPELVDSGISDRDEEISDIQCYKCEKFYSVKTRVIYEFDIVGDCKKNKQLPHLLQKGRSDSSPYICLNCKNEYYEFEMQGKHSWHLDPQDFIEVPRLELKVI